jgi:hypothetical protein
MAALKSLDTDLEMAKNRSKEELPLSASSAQQQPEKQVPSSRHKQIVDTACICLNIASTVLLVFLNKWCVVSSVAWEWALNAPCWAQRVY